MLAVILPPRRLIVASAWHLRDIQRKKEIEAVLERNYQQVLAIAEKRIDDRAFKMTEGIREKFPDADQPEDLELSSPHTRMSRMRSYGAARAILSSNPSPA